MKTRKEELKDLYYAIKQNLSKRMSELKAIQRATNLTVRVEQDESMTIEDIRAMRDKYLKGEKLERPKEIKKRELYILRLPNGSMMFMHKF
jgi:hypothetical protein|nr:MAG TPA: hypothetical protein [Caudoviricetes sp.]